MQPTVVSLFSGGGGSSQGFYHANYDERLAVEWDDNAIATFRRNFPNVPVYHGDIVKLSSKKAMNLAQLNPRELDVLASSPPCQSFSSAGKRSLHDSRGNLFQEHIRLMQDFQPKTFVMENVQGMIRGHLKGVYLQIVKALRDCGYRVKGQVMNAKYYGVPQSRERVIIIGVRNDLGIEPSHPKPQQHPISIKEAMQGLIINETERQRLLELGQKYSTYKIWKTLKPGDHGLFASYIRPDPTRPSPTILKTIGIIGAHSMMHWDEQRRPTIGELKRLASFPDSFEFVGSYSDAGSRIGNSVPPMLMSAIALHIKTQILSRI